MTSVFFLSVLATMVIALTHPVFVTCDRRLSRKRLRPMTTTATVAETGTARLVRGFRITMHRHSEAVTFHHSSQCLDDMARRLRLGHSPTVAFVDAVRMSSTLSRVCNDAATSAQHCGNVGTAVEGLLMHSDAVIRGFATAVWVSQSGHGMSVAALDRAARSHRDRFAVLEEKRAATAASRYSTMILTLLPAASLLLSPLWGTHAFSAFVSSPMVAIAIVAGVGLNVAGFVWTKRIGDALA